MLARSQALRTLKRSESLGTRLGLCIINQVGKIFNLANQLVYLKIAQCTLVTLYIHNANKVSR